jgi:hypothetical protein
MPHRAEGVVALVVGEEKDEVWSIFGMERTAGVEDYRKEARGEDTEI